MAANPKDSPPSAVKAAFEAAKVTDVVDALKSLCNQTEDYLPVAGPLILIPINWS